MGLDISHNTWHGAYSAFMTWRKEIAKCLGIPILLMEGFYPRQGDTGFMHPFSMVLIAIDRNPLGAKEQFERETEMLPLRWDAFKPNPIHELLYHSDCDGEIEWEKCSAIADSLEELLTELPNNDFGGHIGDFQKKTKQFIEGLRKAHKAKENLVFG